jgi:hypothetical protein
VRQETLRTHAEWFVQNEDAKRAVPFYFLLRDFEKILTLKLKPRDDNRWFPELPPQLSKDSYADILRSIAAHCTEEMRTRHPQFMLQLALEFFVQGRRKEFIKLLKEMDTLFPVPGPAKPPGPLPGPPREKAYLPASASQPS